MNMKFNIAQFKDRFLRKKKDHTKIDINPKRGWKILVISFLTANILIIALYLYTALYRDSSDEALVVERAGRGVGTINREALQDVLQTYGEKERFLDKLRTERISTVDPAE